MIEKGNIDFLYNFKKDFIVVDCYDTEIMEKVFLLKNSRFWSEIDNLMEHEFLFKWKRFKDKDSILKEEKNDQS